MRIKFCVNFIFHYQILKRFSHVDHVKAFIEFVTILFLFYILFFRPQCTWNLISPTRDQSCTACNGRWNLTPGPPGKSHQLFIQMKCSILMAKKKNLLNCITTVCTFWHLAVNSVSKLHLGKKAISFNLWIVAFQSYD